MRVYRDLRSIRKKGNDMQELKKILKEIDKYISLYNTPPTGREVEGTVELLG